MKKIKCLWLPLLSFVLIELAIVFVYKAPLEETMGIIQKIFYFHIALGIGSFIAFGLNFLASLAYLLKGHMKWDRRAAASAEIGLLFAGLVILTGILWAKPAWNIWWSWDPRLTTTLILWLIYASYFAFRRAIPSETLKARLSAVIGIIGFTDVPIVYGSIFWWQRGLHPRMELIMEPTMRAAEITALLAILCFLAGLLYLRWNVEDLKYRLFALEERKFKE